jgi:ectoine hydroxylase-related dioxygenase (phytanoyl-CoA dioxygenase family)
MAMDAVLRPLAAERSVTEAYWQDGAVCIPGALDAAEMAMARELFSWSRNNLGQAAQTLDFGADGSIFIETHNRAARETYLGALAKSGIPALVAAALGVDELWYLGEQIYIKQGRPGTCVTAWHQDSDLPIDANGAVCLWISFENLEHESALEFVRGSHLGPRYNHIIGTQANGQPLLLYPTAAEQRPFPDVDAARNEFDMISWATKPGDVVLFHSLTIHGGAPVPHAGLRNTLCLRFFGSDTRYLQLPERTPTGTLAAETTDYLWDGLTDGDPLRRGTRFAKVIG